MRKYSDILKYFQEKHPDICIKERELMKNHTSFRIGGPCDLMLCPKSVEELQQSLSALRQFEERPLILGGGTNVLVPDSGIPGVVIVTKEGMNRITQVDETTVAAECGAMMTKLSIYAMEHSLTGLEFAQGIPGSVGGAVYMNAGAYDGETRNVAYKTTFLTMDGELQEYVGDAQRLTYRNSAFQNMDGLIVETEFRFVPGSTVEIREKMQDYAYRRRTKQPLEYPSAGSTFKRPTGYFAGALIEEAGLKGFRIGGAGVSEKHAGFVVNYGGATAADVLAVIQTVQNRVYENSGVMLEPEVRLL